MSLKSVKHIASRIRVYSFLKKQTNKIPICTDVKRTRLTPVDIGLVPSPIEYELDYPSTNLFKPSDGIHFVGISSERHAIDLCINRMESETASVWVYLKLSDGNIYKFPSADTRRVSHANENAYFSSGLQVKCLSPLRKWRVSFNGLLEKCNSEEDGELVHTRFSFVWLAMSRVQEQNRSYRKKEIMDAFIKENVFPKHKDLQCLYDLQNRYEQWGQMMGTITFNGESEKEFYFWSIKTRISDSPLWNANLISTKFYMYFMDGVPLKIENISVENSVSNLTSGFSVTPSGGIKHISHCNFDRNLLEENDREINFSCLLNGKEKNIDISFIGGDTTLYTGPELQFQVKIRPFKVQMNECDEGFGILHHSVRSNNEDKKEYPFPPVVLRNSGHSSSDETILLFEDEECRSSVIAGGKGSSLALLTELAKKTNEFVVPRGFVITTDAFKDHLNYNKDVFDAVQRLKDVSCKIVDGVLKTECNKCRETFVSTQLSDHQKDEIKHALESAYDSLENVRFSVRSSAFGEDSEDLSAAGQMLTLLDIRGIDSIFKAVVQCWSSNFGFEAVQYARQNGQSLLSPMAVVIQEMVPSDFAGVMFTVDPVSGDPTYPYITANFGLGETVVSSTVNPDTVKLKREKDQSLSIFEVHVGSKEKQLFLKTEDDIQQKTYESQSEKSCLTNEWAVRIGKVGLLIESCFGSPRDIEWAVHKEQLYLLQARPITTLHKETDFELMHDQDTPVRYLTDYFTTANVGEVFPGALSPLAISLVVGGMNIIGHIDQVEREKQPEEFCPYFFHIMPITQRHVTMNLIDALLKTNEQEVSPLQRAFEVALFGRIVITDEIHQLGIKKYGYASFRENYLILVYISKLMSSVLKTLNKVNKEIEKYRLPLETYTSAEKTLNGIMDQMALFSRVIAVHNMTTFLASFCNMILMTVLKSGREEWNAEVYSDFSTLLSYSGVESVDVPGSLQELARTIAWNHGRTFSSRPVEDAYYLLKNDAGPSGKLFEKFIERHGHRCAKEFDIYSKSWRMDSESLIQILQSMVKAPNVLDINVKEILSTEAVLSKITTPLSNSQRWFLQLLLPRCRKHVCNREKSKSMLVQCIDWLRASCYHLGDLMVKEGMLPDQELVFFLTMEEIKEVVDSQKPGLVHKAARRKHLHQQLNELKFAEIMQGIPKPITQEVQQDYSEGSTAFTLKGTPVCRGTIKGKAVVVLALEDASKIESGDILITYSTDIGWSPYFPLLSGIVTVLGGLISHGAVIAREFGLPCIVAVENATAAFKTGDIVILNGTEGTITKVLDEEK